ncbi:MAG: class I SAM-dependent methyltransferase [Ignavibacteriales bacterium]|nr:class I SAM-dependent methyltransferase [Ignavibacteriales bacterium]
MRESLCKIEISFKRVFEEYTVFRYKKTHHLPLYINFDCAAGKDVLEIGLGIGADGINWARKSKTYTGVDLTNEAVEATKIHFNLKGLAGNIIQGNAEKLDFPNEAFDLVYSHGVLHHTPNMVSAFNEINRVLRKNGEIIIMLYAKESFNYWIRIQLLFRIRLIIEIIKNYFGIKSKGVWKAHIFNFKKIGGRYMSWKEFPHHCTDGPDCAIAFILSKQAVIKLFEKLVLKLQKLKSTLPWG